MNLGTLVPRAKPWAEWLVGRWRVDSGVRITNQRETAAGSSIQSRENTFSPRTERKMSRERKVHGMGGGNRLMMEECKSNQ